MTATSLIASVLCLAFFAAGGAKLAGAPVMREAANHLGVPFGIYRVIGTLEIAGVLGLAIGFAHKGIGVAAAICLCLLMIGGVGTHLRSGDPPARAAPAFVLAILAAAYAWLRLSQG